MGVKQGQGRFANNSLPEDWELLQLTTVARLESGHTPSRRNPQYWDGAIPWVSLHDTGSLDAKELLDTAKKITPLGLANSSARLLPKGTVVFSRTATVGKVSVLGREMATSQDFANYVCGPRVHNHFLAYLFKGMASEWKKLMAGSIHNTVYMPVFKALSVPLPPPREQEAIAEALSDADALIESLEQLLAKKRQIKQGAMLELLTGKSRLPGFNDEWEPKSLGELLTICHGKSQREVEVADGPYPILATSGEIGRARAYLWSKPSVLIGRKGTIDRPQFMDTPFWTVDTLFYSDIAAPNSAKFLFYRFCLIDWKQYNEASGVPSLNARTIEQIEIDAPKHDEQAAIAAVLSDMDREISQLEANLAKVRQLKQGMMQELLTGRIRLV